MSAGRRSSRRSKVGLEHSRAGRSEAGRQFRGAHAPRQLEQRQRVATSLRDQPLTEVLVEPAGDDRGEQRARIVVVEPLQAQLGQARQLALLTRLADGEDERDPLGQQAARHEPERLRGGLVEPLEVVHETQQRLRLGHLRQQCERCQADQEAVGSRAGREAERHSQGSLLGLRERSEATEQRPAELVQAGERQLHLRLDAGDLDDPEPWSLVRGEAQQRRLAHPRLAADDEHAATALARRLDEPIQRLALARAATERGGHMPATLSQGRMSLSVASKRSPDSSSWPSMCRRAGPSSVQRSRKNVHPSSPGSSLSAIASTR